MSKSELKQPLEEMYDYCEVNQLKKYSDSIIRLLANFSKNESDKSKSLIGHEQYHNKFNQIVDRTLVLINEITENA